MLMFKCKICGGTLAYSEGSSVCECQYCGTMQTLPQVSGEHSTTLYQRADHFRRNNDFDKAISVYEQILNENNTDAEAYWSLVLCRYGVEYVEDPKSNKRIATVNRMQYTSVLADEDYKSAIRYADAAQREIYEAEAREIDGIQKGILAISQKEEPFDVFICYKETDNNGRRTPDSVLANELYHQLDNEGYKVFFSRITLEDKLGTAYEPYIFAALNSAKVMVVIGTKAEYFNAVWVRNEWSRFLALIKNGANKVLIPAYRDMDPYDLPEEFSHLQAQDMSKLGFMQDLIRGIEKLTGTSKPKTAKERSASGGANTAPLLRRAFLFLEDGDWTSADEYCEKVLDLDPENGEAYLGKLMAELKIRRRESLSEQTATFDDNSNYKKALRFGSDELQNELKSAIKAINQKAERARLAAAYKSAELILASVQVKEDYIKAAEAFESIGDFEDAKQRAAECREKHKEAHFGGLYTAAMAAMQYAKNEEDFRKAEKAFDQIKGYKDSEALAAECAKKAEFIHKNAIYTAAVALITGNKPSNYKKAISQLEKVRGFKDSDARIEFCNRKIEQINAAVLAASVEKQNRARARADAIHAGAEAIREKLPLIKKVAYVVVPVLIVAILATAILPKIDFSRPKDKGSSMECAPTTVPATGPEESLPAATQPGQTQPSATQPGETQPVTTQPPAVQQPTPQRPTPQRPTTQQPTPQQPSANPVRHEEGCPFNNGMHADLFAKEIGTFHSCQPYPTTDGNGNVISIDAYRHERRYDDRECAYYYTDEGVLDWMYYYTSDGHYHYYTYFPNGNVKVQHEEDYNKKTIVSIEYDVNGNVIAEVVNQIPTRYEYNNGKLVSKLESKTDASGNRTEILYRYNDAGVVVDKREKTNDSNYDPVECYEYQYDESGKLLYYVYHDFKPAGEDTITIYNSQNSVLCKTYVNVSLLMAETYDGAGNPIGSWVDDVCVFETKDSSGNSVARILVGGAAPGMIPKTVYCKYDANGNLLSRKETLYCCNYAGQIQETVYDSKGGVVKQTDFRCDVSYSVN